MKKGIRLFFAYLVFGVLMSNGIIRFKGLDYTTESLGNSTFIVGALFIFIGAIRYLRRNNLFTLVIYSYKKFFEIVRTKNYTKKDSSLRDYHDYLESREVDDDEASPFGPIVLNGVLFSAFATLIVWKSF